MRLLLVLAVAACGSSSPPPVEPAPFEYPPPIDALPDAGPSAELAAAPAWVFRFSTPDRVETWTLQHHGETAMIVVDREEYAVTYLGTATRDGEKLEIAVAAGAFQLEFRCRVSGKEFRTTCDDYKKTRSIDVIDCWGRGKATPMSFGLAPGVEYAEGRVTCNGYRLLP